MMSRAILVFKFKLEKAMDFCESKHNNTKHRQNCLTFRSMSKWRSKIETILLFVAFLLSNIPLSQGKSK